MERECRARRTPPALVKRMRVVFVGGLKAAQKAGQIQFLKGIGVDQMLVVYEADVADLDQYPY